MGEPYKFGWPPDGSEERAYEYPNVWARETTSGPDRLVIAPRENQIPLLERLTERLTEPFFLLYVLLVSRTGQQPGRYQQKSMLSRSELRFFLHRYRTFLEGDGRHALWIRSEDQGMLVYDQHNVIYGYGPLDVFVHELSAEGLAEAADIRFPVTHTHRYNQQFDGEQEDLIASREWIRSDLRPGDDDE